MKQNQGFVLPLTLMLMTVVALLVIGTSMTMMFERANASNDRTASQAEEVAKAGYAKYKTASFQTFSYYMDNLDKYATEASRSAQCGNLLSIGLDLGRDGLNNTADNMMSGDKRVETIKVGDQTGEYTVTTTVSGSGVVLRSVGKVGDARAEVQGFLTGQNSSVFSNAIFSGAGGQVGAHLNGSADIYGSVYVEGSPSDPEAISASGNFGVHNHYTKSTLESLTGLSGARLQEFLKLQALEQKDMCATVRARYGSINFSANSSVGDAQTDTMTQAGFKGSVKGVYASSVSGSNIHTETQGPFDLEPPPVMPKLDSTGIVDLSKLPANVKAAVGTNPTWRQTMQTEANLNGLRISMSGSTPMVTPPDAASTCNISSVISGGTMTFAETAISCKNAAGRGFTYSKDPALNTWVLDINGTLDLQGLNVLFKQNVIVRYEGKASMLVEKKNGVGGNVSIEGDVLPFKSFPDRDVLGIIAENNLTITGANQNQLGYTKQQVVTGLFYAGNQISAVKDSVVLGTIMGNSFDLSNGSNGGSAKTQLFQVPGLEYNLPPGFSTLADNNRPTFMVYSYERK